MRFPWTGTAMAALLLAAPPARGQADAAESLLRARLTSDPAPRAAGQALHAADAVRGVYHGEGYRLFWISRWGISPAAGDLLAFVEAIGEDGLRPSDYHAGAIRRLVERGAPADPAQQVELELLLTDAFLAAGRDLLRGRVAARAIHPGWSLAGRTGEPGALLPAAVRHGRVRETLAALRPEGPGYASLSGALHHYRAVAAAGGWQPLPARTLRPGDAGPAVVALRRRVAAEGMWLPAADSARYDAELAAAVRILQRRLGLGEDAVVGPATRAALGVPVERRLEQLEATLERERWLPVTLGERYVAVFIPAFELHAVEPGSAPLTMRVIGGKPSWRTPVFSGRMTSAVFNPYWNIPPSIWNQEVAPRAAREPGYLSREGIHAVRDGGGVRWRQSPGPRNPLGKVKLVFPNRYNVYLHDTSSPSLFRREERALSHGCIRVEDPLGLATFALARTPGWGAEAVRAEAARTRERTVALAEAIPVHILYRTAWVDGTGGVHFRSDLYGHDGRLIAALRGGRARPAAERGAEEHGQ